MENDLLTKLECYNGEISLDIDNLAKAISLLEDDKYNDNLALTLVNIREITSYLLLIHSDLLYKYNDIENFIKSEYEKKRKTTSE